MKNLQEKTSEIIATIPLSYYTTTNELSLTLDTRKQTSCICFNDKTIYIAFKNIKSAVDNLTATPSDRELEEIIRGLVYHEVSHALLTDAERIKDARKTGLQYYNATLQNILEDERIETLLEHYYLRTNFKKNKRLILTAPSVEDMKKDFNAFVFGVARCDLMSEYYHYIKEFINKTKARPSAYRYYNNITDTLYLLYTEWLKLKDQEQEQEEDQEQEENNEEQQPQEDAQEGDQEDEEPTEVDTTPSDSEEEEEQEEEKEEEEEEETTSTTTEEQEQELTEEERQAIKETIKSAILGARLNEVRKDFYTPLDRSTLDNSLYNADAELKRKLIEIVARSGGLGQAKHYNGGGYAGQFNFRNYLHDQARPQQTYRWFNTSTKKQNQATSKARKLNILLDNSGSFARNDQKASEILKALAELEEITNFEFRLFIHDNKLQEVKGTHRVSFSNTCDGGNDCFCYDHDAELEEITKENTIFLIDGLLCYSSGFERYAHNLRKLNNSKVIMILDDCTENHELFKDFNSCEKIYTRDYCGELSHNILKAFELLFK